MHSASRSRGNWLITFGLICILMPIPVGFRSAELSLFALGGFFFLLFIQAIRLSRLHIAALFIFVCLLGTGIGILRGENFSVFQFFRGVTFPLILVALLYCEFHVKTYSAIKNLIPFVVLGAFTSSILYFVFGSDLYNSTLDIPYDDAQYKRFFVYPTYFFLILLVEAVARGRSSQFVYALILAASGSKAIYLSIMVIYAFLGLSRLTAKNIGIILIGLILVSVAAFQAGMVERVVDFVEQGDPWRYYEPLAAINRLSDPITFFIGNGSGIPYWEGRIAVVDYSADLSRVTVNSAYDVHNGLLTIFLRFGVPLGLWYLWLVFKAIPRVRGQLVLALVLGINVSLSHGPVQMVEAVGLALGICLFRFNSTAKSKPSPPFF